MATVKEQTIINTLATEFSSIAGIKTTYGFAQNPDALQHAALPAVVFVPVGFESQLKGHHNIHQNVITISGITFVAERQSQGGTLRYLENEAMPFLYKIRNHFQTASVITTLLGLGLTQATIISGQYGAGGPLLTYNGIEYIGIISRWQFYEVN